MTDVVSNIVINDRASAVAERVAAALDKLTDSEQRAQAGADAVDKKVATSARTLESAARSFETLKRSADPAYAALSALADQSTRLQRAVDLGVASETEATVVRQRLAAAADASIQRATVLTAAHADLTKSTGALTTAFSLNRAGLLELQAAGINAFQALAAGMSPLRVATMEGAQAFGAFAQGGLGVSGVLSKLVSPIGLAIGGVTAFVAILATGAIRAADLAATSRALGVSLEGMGKSAQTSVAELRTVTDELVKFGIARSDANAAIQAVIRSPGQLVPPQLTGQIVTSAGNQSAVQGTDLLAETNALTKAIQGGADGLEKYLLDRNAATAADLAAIRAQERMGDTLGMVKTALNALDFASGGKYQESLSAWQRFWKNMGESLDTFLNTLAQIPVAVEKAIAAGPSTLRQPAAPGGYDPNTGLFVPTAPPIPQVTPLEQANAARIAAGLVPLGGSPAAAASTSGYAANFSIGSNVQVYGEVPQLADALSHAAEQLPPGYSIVVTSGGRPGGSNSPVGMGSAHVTGSAADFQIVGPNGPLPNTGADVTGLYGQTFTAAQAYAAWAYPQLGLRNGATFGANGGPISASSPADIGHIDTRGMTPAGANDVAKLNEDLQRQNQILEQSLPQRAALRAQQEAFNAELAKSHDAVAAEAAGQVAYNKVLSEAQTAFRDDNDAMARATAGAGQVADAWVTSRAAAMTATAAVQAHEAASTKLGVSEGTLRQAILDRQAADISAKAGETIANTQEQVAATQALAKAELGGAAAVQEAERVEKAREQTRELAAAAAVTSSDDIRNRLLKQIDTINDLSKADTAATNTRAANALKFQQEQDLAVATLQRQIALETDPDTIRADTLKVQALQDEFSIRQKLKGATEDQISAATREAAAIRQVTSDTAALNAIKTRAQSIADSIGQSLLDAYTQAGQAGKSFFDNLLTTLQTGIKTAVASLAIELLKQHLIVPVLAEVIGTAPGLFGLASPSGATTAGGSGGGVSAGTLLQGGGLLKDIFGSSSSTGGGLFSGIGTSINSFGTSLGFAEPSIGGLSAVEMAKLGIPGVNTGIFGGATLTQFLGGAGAGLAAGGLLNALIGGNTLTGTIGSGLGSLAGAAIGSIIPGIGTLLGGLIGGAGGGLFGGPLGRDRSTFEQGRIVFA